MENRNNVLLIMLISVVILLLWGLSENYHNQQLPKLETKSCKEDSLRNVITQLQIDLEIEEDGWDKKERRYEDILFEYEFGISHLKEYHSDAYKDFHRIIGYKENYSHETERENKKRLDHKTKLFTR